MSSVWSDQLIENVLAVGLAVLFLTLVSWLTRFLLRREISLGLHPGNILVFWLVASGRLGPVAGAALLMFCLVGTIPYASRLHQLKSGLLAPDRLIALSGLGLLPLILPFAREGNAPALLALHYAGAHVLGVFVVPLVRRSVRSNESDDTGTLDAELTQTQGELALMADRAYEMLMIVLNVSQVADQIDLATERVIALRSEIKSREETINVPLLRSIQRPCTPEQARRIQQQQRITKELSLVADDCYKTMRLLSRSYRKNHRFHHESRNELFGLISQIMDFLRYNADYLEDKINAPDWDVANRMEDAIDSVRDTLKKHTRRVLERSEDVDIAGELVFIDIVSHLEHVGDRCLSIAEAVRQGGAGR